MGMDVFGINPTTEAGEHFRADFWSWDLIHSLICECMEEEPFEGEPLFTEEQRWAMSFNAGAPGFVARPVLDELAARLERKASAVEQFGGGAVARAASDGPLAGTANAVMRALQGRGADPEACKASAARIREFIAFLRGCGDGFAVR